MNFENFEIDFDKEAIRPGKFALKIKERLYNSNGKATGLFYRTYRKDIARFFNCNMREFTNILKKRYNVEIYGGKKYHSYYLFNFNELRDVKEYLESALILKVISEA